MGCHRCKWWWVHGNGHQHVVIGVVTIDTAGVKKEKRIKYIPMAAAVNMVVQW